MLKTISIGDIHGNQAWRLIEDICLLLDGKTFIPKYDKYIFVGDYVDSFTETDETIINNLKEIIKFKKMFPDHVVLILGNHDLPYFFSEYKRFNFTCSGNRMSYMAEIHDIFHRNRDLFVPMYKIDNYIWSHAGFTSKFLDYLTHGTKDKFHKIDKIIKDKFETLSEDLFWVSRARGGMDDFPGIFWADKSETAFNMPKGTHQIVGHSRVDDVIKVECEGRKSSITYLDCLDNVLNYHILTINKDA